jgi:hypothetical protein
VSHRSVAAPSSRGGDAAEQKPSMPAGTSPDSRGRADFRGSADGTQDVGIVVSGERSLAAKPPSKRQRRRQ